MLHVLLSWATTVPFMLAFGMILLVFDPAQRIARLFGQRAQERVAGGLQWSVMQALRICGTRVEVERSPLVRPGTPYLLVSNHQSLFDVAMLGGLMLTNFPKYVAKKELARGIPSVSYHLRRGGNAIIDRANRGQALVAIRALGKQAEARGVSAVIYPEGTRARDGVLKPFKRGGMHELLAAAPTLPVIPVAIDGSWKLVAHRWGPIPFGTTVHVALLDPMPRAPDEDREKLAGTVEDQIRSTVDAWRAADPAMAARRLPDTRDGRP